MLQQVYSTDKISSKRVLIHVVFWLLVLTALTFIYGINKPSYFISFRNSLFYMPVHLIYFYSLAYYFIPKFLLRGKYLFFAFCVFFLAISVVLLTRLIDIFIVDPYLDKVFKSLGIKDEWMDMQGNFWKKFTNPYYFVNAIKASNLVAWIAIAIKLFKLWYERRQAALLAELNFLKAQIHPHFLFNTLNNLYALTLNQSPKAPHIVIGLSEILRYMLYECDKEYISLKKDLEILESYIALEKLRYEDRLELNFSISGQIQEQQIAPLLLIPLVENAFKHGVSEQVGESWIKMDLTIQNQKLKFKIANSKPQFMADDRHIGNIGLTNVKKRLMLIYPDAHELKIKEDEDMFLIVLDIDLTRVKQQS
jgi:hypothetical protein